MLLVAFWRCPVYHQAMNKLTIVNIRNGNVALPKGLRKALGSKALVVSMDDGLYLKPLTAPSFVSLQPKLKKAGTLVTEKEITAAVAWARQSLYARRS